MILYWARLINSKENKLSKLIYSLIYKLYEKDLFHSSWITSVKNILDSAGFSGIWTNQSLPKSPDHFNTILKLRLHDQFIQNWNEGITKGGKCTVYRIIKKTFGFEKYLTELPVNNSYDKISVPQSPSTNRSWLSGSNSARPTVMPPLQ